MKSPTAFGIEMFHTIDASIQGHICIHEAEAGFLAEMIYRAGDGDHLEIGSMWGGSAILAALTKKEYGLTGHVVCIEPFRDSDCSFRGLQPNPDIFRKNMGIMGVDDVVDLNVTYSSPFPFADHHFVSAYVDGDHAGDWPTVDWNNVRLVSDMVIYHDLRGEDYPVLVTAKIIRNDPGWKEIKQVETMAAWRKL